LIITPEGIQFKELKAFSRFIIDNDLYGNIQLTDPLKDKTGNILIKEQVNIKENAIKKLETMEGQYDPNFKVRITDDLLNRMREKIASSIIPRIESSKVQFTKYLYDNNSSSVSNYKGFIQTAMYQPWIVLHLYDLKYYNPEFFYYVSDMALLTLAIVIQKSYPFRFVNRYAFLTGLLSDIILSETDHWKQPLGTEADLTFLSKMSSSVATKLHLPEQISQPIANQTIPGIFSENNNPLNIETIKKHPLFFLNINPPEESVEEEDDFKVDCIQVITESQKITRFIMECYKKIDDKDKLSEKLLMMLTYNTAKGLFSEEIAGPVIRRFKEYDKLVKKIRKIAELENQCLHPPSSWAYPKPNATQILCKNRVFDCKYFLAGWDINIVSPQSAYGYVGTNLTPGSYPKCQLEKELDKKVHQSDEN
jgi:hypothetical protein